MVQLNILISGAGIGGGALAFWLSRAGHRVTVIEQAPSLRSTGLQIDLRDHGIEVLKRMGLEPEFLKHRVVEEGLEIIDRTGRRRAYFPANTTGEGPQSFSSDHEIMRGDLCDILYDASKERVRYVFGQTIRSFEEVDDGVEVEFSDGKKDRFDLLLGADGIGSRTRRLMLGPNSADPITYVGVHVGYYNVPRKLVPNEKYLARFYFAPGKRLVFTRRSKDDEIQVYLSYVPDADQVKAAKRLGPDEEKATMVEKFRGAGWQTDALLKHLDDVDDFYCQRLGVVQMDAWYSRHVALVGDAAHCPSALTGMGTTSAMVGAYILAGEIQKHCSGTNGKDGIPSALKEYDQKLRPLVQQIQRGILEGSSPFTKLPSSSWGVAVLNLVLSFLAFVAPSFLVRLLSEEDVLNWSLPEYENMDERVGA